MRSFIVSCLVVSLPQLLTVVMGRSLDTQPVTLCVFGIMFAVVLSHLTQFHPEELLSSGVEFAKVVVYYLLVVALLTTPAQDQDLRLLDGDLHCRHDSRDRVALPRHH